MLSYIYMYKCCIYPNLYTIITIYILRLMWYVYTIHSIVKTPQATTTIYKHYTIQHSLQCLFFSSHRSLVLVFAPTSSTALLVTPLALVLALTALLHPQGLLHLPRHFPCHRLQSLELQLRGRLLHQQSVVYTV